MELDKLIEDVLKIYLSTHYKNFKYIKIKCRNSFLVLKDNYPCIQIFVNNNNIHIIVTYLDLEIRKYLDDLIGEIKDLLKIKPYVFTSYDL